MGGWESSSDFFKGTGTFDWTRVEFTFTAPQSGNVTVGARLGFYGSTVTGEAWFDDLDIRPYLQNAAFEDGTETPVSWTEDKWNSENSVMSLENAGRSGKCVSIENTAENDARWIQQIEGLTPGTVYKFSGWIKGNSISDNGASGANICLMGGWESSSDFFKGTGTFDWTRVEFTFTAPQSGNVTVGARLGFYGSTVTGEAWFDDLDIVPVQ